MGQQGVGRGVVPVCTAASVMSNRQVEGEGDLAVIDVPLLTQPCAAAGDGDTCLKQAGLAGN